jgi:hypothetical protein
MTLHRAKTIWRIVPRPIRGKSKNTWGWRPPNTDGGGSPWPPQYSAGQPVMESYFITAPHLRIFSLLFGA